MDKTTIEEFSHKEGISGVMIIGEIFETIILKELTESSFSGSLVFGFSLKEKNKTSS